MDEPLTKLRICHPLTEQCWGAQSRIRQFGGVGLTIYVRQISDSDDQAEKKDVPCERNPARLQSLNSDFPHLLAVVRFAHWASA